MFTGNLFETARDTEFPSPNRHTFHFQRSYNSRSGRIGVLGHGWSHSFSSFLEHAIVYNGQTYVRITDETGREVYFQQQTNGTFTPAFQEKSHLVVENGDYIWKRLDNSRFVFSADGKLSRIEDQVENRLMITYTDEGDIDAVQDLASGRTLTFHYDGVHPGSAIKQLTHISGPVTDSVQDGIWVSYSYDQANLASISYPDGSGFHYAYDINGHLIEKKNNAGEVLSTWSHVNNRAVSNVTPDGKGVTIDYTDTNHVQVTDAYGRTRRYAVFYYHGRPRVYDISRSSGCQECEDGLTQLDYDDAMNVTKAVYGNGRTQIYSNYDAQGRPRQITQEQGSADEKTVTLTYHPTLEAILTRTETSLLSTGKKEVMWDYDNDGNTTPNENPGPLVHRKIERGFTTDGSGAVVSYEHVTGFTYDAKGQLTAVDGPLPGEEDTVRFAYDPLTGDLLNQTLPETGATTFQYDAAGNMISATDANGLTTTFDHDGRNRLIKTIAALGMTSSRSYNQGGHVASTTDSAGRTTRYAYTASGLLASIIDPAGNSLDYQYNAQGHPLEEVIQTAAGGQVFYRGYDYGDPAQDPELRPGHPWKILQRDNGNILTAETVYIYDRSGTISSITDGSGNTTAYTYDRYNRLTKETKPGGATITYSYDRHDNLIRVTDELGNATTFTHDDPGRVLTSRSLDTGLTRFSYDAVGNLLSLIDAKNQTISFAYDALNRPVTQTYPGAARPIQYTYDQSFKGRLSAVQEEESSRSFTYNAMGQLTAETTTIGSTSTTIGYSYSTAGELLAMTYPTGRVLDFTRDTTGRIAELTVDNVPLATGIGFHPFGPMTRASLGGLSLTRSHDLRYRVDRIRGAALDFTYTRDQAGQVTGITGVSVPTVTGITETATYGPGNNHLTGTNCATAKTYSHDVNGNIVSDGIHTYTWDALNRLTRVEKAGAVVATYGYDSQNRRIRKTVGDQTIHYHYDLNNQLIAETLADGTPLRDYFYLGSEPLALREYETNPGTYYYLNDHLGTPQQLITSTGTVVWEAAYLPYGQAQVKTATVANNLRFPGQYFDAETGLQYNLNRYYDPETGRYLSADPIGLEGGMNLYAYVQNNPVNWVDPDGLSPTAGGAAIGGIIAGPPGAVAGAVIGTVAGVVIGQAIWDNWFANEADDAPVVYPDNPETTPEKFNPMKGRKGKVCEDDGAVWEKDNSSHGGDQWKRWPKVKDYEKGNTPQGIWPDGRIRK